MRDPITTGESTLQYKSHKTYVRHLVVGFQSWDGRNKVVKMKQNQCIVHSKIIDIIENKDVNDMNTNDFGVDLTAKGAS